ncbi:histidine kinase [Alginatibacterium sediminis]|uniref:histidine kinase n=2 Tax=Alginatibacterium sediminis TaxID=2164068 RepID=A0A420ELK2_9ALTE|nr:histidine kinase [Alginatibacterium sediminis]
MVICGAGVKHEPLCEMLTGIKAYGDPLTLVIRDLSEDHDPQQLAKITNIAGLNGLLLKPYTAGAFISQVQRLVEQYRSTPQLLERYTQHHQDWLQQKVEAKVSKMRAGFFDYTSMTDAELVDKVSQELFKFFQDNDENHLCRTYSKGHLLTQEGAENDFLWFISSGEVVLKRSDEEQELEVARMGTGSLVGGMSFVTGERAFTSGETTCNTEVIKLDRKTFARVMETSSSLLALFTNLLLRNFNRRLQKSILTKLQLQRTINSLDQAYEQLFEKEKMAVLGQLIAGVAHELNNPVAAILRGSETISEHIPDLVRNSLPQSEQQLGLDILQSAMKISPLSTRDIRSRAREAQQYYPNNLMARKAVLMGLDSKEAFKAHFTSSDSDTKLDALEKYHQVGTFLRNISVCSHRIADLVKSLKHYSGQDPEQQVESDINEGLAETVMILDNRLKHFNVDCRYGELPSLACYPIALQQVWTNLIANALDAMEEGGNISISSQFFDVSPSYINVVIEDNGPGIPDTIKDKIFELNYTTKREGNFGLGIGLTICQQIVTQHQGQITVVSEPGNFTRFTVSLPVNHQRG